MKAIKATYRNGQITLSEPLPDPDPGPIDVLVVFPEEADDPWERILNDPRPRPALEKLVKEVEEESTQGKTAPLDLSQL
jgi:hypothetical protein